MGNFYLDDFVTICDFDSTLRNIILQGLEAIEVSTRVAIAYEMGKRGKFSYLEP